MKTFIWMDTQKLEGYTLHKKSHSILEIREDNTAIFWGSIVKEGEKYKAIAYSAERSLKIAEQEFFSIKEAKESIMEYLTWHGTISDGDKIIHE